MLLECRFEVWRWFKDAGLEEAITKIEVKYAGHWTGGAYAVVTCPSLELAQRAFNAAYNWTSKVKFGMSVELSYVGIRWLECERECLPYPPYELPGQQPHAPPGIQQSVPIAPQPGPPGIPMSPWGIQQPSVYPTACAAVASAF